MFTAPRAFEGQFERVQMNALRSWIALRPRPEVLVFGAERGTEEACEELGLRWIPDVALTDGGLPVFSDVLVRADGAAGADRLAYVNIDIILMQDTLDAIAAVDGRFAVNVIFGSPWNLSVPYDLDTAETDWQERLRLAAKTAAKPPTRYGADVVVYPRGYFSDAPPLAIGRGWFDCWMMSRARSHPAPAVDITDAALILHQDHSGSTHTWLSEKVWIKKDPDTLRNVAHTRWWHRLTFRQDIPLALTAQDTLRKRLLRGRLAFAVRVVFRHAFAWVLDFSDRRGLAFSTWWRRIRTPKAWR